MQNAAVRVVGVLIVALVTGSTIAASARGPQTTSGGRASAAAQTKIAGIGPDIAGMRPGMTLQEAYKRLKAHNPSARIDVGEQHIPELGQKPFPVVLIFKSSISRDAEAPEVLQLELTPPPGTPLVWAILQRLAAEPGK